MKIKLSKSGKRENVSLLCMRFKLDRCNQGVTSVTYRAMTRALLDHRILSKLDLNPVSFTLPLFDSALSKASL